VLEVLCPSLDDKVVTNNRAQGSLTFQPNLRLAGAMQRLCVWLFGGHRLLPIMRPAAAGDARNA
jgi:hypothetical protein